MTDDSYRTLVVDAFATEPLGGTPVGVVPDAAGLDEAAMRALATELGHETAFVFPNGATDGHELVVRSPDHLLPTEVDRRDAAAVAAHSQRRRDGELDPGRYAVPTNGDRVETRVTDDGVVLVERPDPTVETVEVDHARVGTALGIDPAAMADVGADLPTAVASAGEPLLLVPVNFLEHLGAAEPGTEALSLLVDEHAVAGITAFTFDAVDGESTLHARTFRVDGGSVREAGASGPVGGALGVALHALGAFDDEFPEQLRCETGHYLDRPGVVRVEVDAADGTSGGGAAPEAVRVGGRATATVDGRAVVPTVDDGIIEA